MSLYELLFLLVIAGVCGAIGSSIAGGTRAGCLGTIAVGFIGALLGLWLARALGLPEVFVVTIDTTEFPVVWSIAGSALFVAVISLVSRGKAR